MGVVISGDPGGPPFRGVVISGVPGVPPLWGVTKLYSGENDMASIARSGMLMAAVLMGVRNEEPRRLERLQSARLSGVESRRLGAWPGLGLVAPSSHTSVVESHTLT